jgi:hypothetical protein
LLVFSPSFVLYENALFYDFLGMALLVWATLALYHFARTGAMKWCVGFFALLGTLLLTRSLFHLVWMVAITAVLIALFSSWRRQILIAAAVPLLVVTLWYAKNYHYFGKFGTSTWMGFGLSNITQALVPLPELIPLVERGELSQWAVVSRYDSRFLMFTADIRPPFGVPVVDNVQKVDGRLNWNYRDIPVVDRYYAADAFTEMRRFPAMYVYGLYLSNCLYFAPTTTGPYWLPSNLEAIRPMQSVFTPLLSGMSANASFVSLGHGRFRFPDDIAVPARANFVLMLAWLGVFAWCYTVARRALVDRTARTSPRIVVMGFLVLTAVYAYVLSTALELGENYRYRFLLEPLFFVLAAAAVTSGIRAVRARRRGAMAAEMASGKM